MVFIKIRTFFIERDIQNIVKKKYYQDVSFKNTDKQLLKAYRFKNPYRISHSIYGETPLPTLEKIAKIGMLSNKDHVLELGAGRGRGAFFFSHFFKCHVNAIEKNHTFVSIAQNIVEKFKVSNLQFLQGDFFHKYWPFATFIYFYGTGFDHDKMVSLFKKVKKGTRIITISDPLINDAFEIVDTFRVFFPWGETNAYYIIKL